MKTARPIKTFGGSRPKITDSPTTSKPCLHMDENVELQAKIDGLLAEDGPSGEPSSKKAKNEAFSDLEQLEANDEDDIDRDLVTKPTIKSLHELLEAGENSRFLDEIEYLVEGLRTGSVLSRLLCLEELLGKAFGCRKFGPKMRAHGMLTKSIEYLGPLVLEGEPRAGAGVALLIVGLCHDIRHLDAFISHSLLISVAQHLQSGKSESFHFKEHLAATQIFKEIPVAYHTNEIVSLWLLAKLAQQSSKTTRELVPEELISMIWEMLQRIVEIEDVDEEFSFIQLRWCLLVTGRFHEESLLLNHNKLLKAISWIISVPVNPGVQRNLALLALGKALVEISGPPLNSEILGSDRDFIKALARISEAVINDHKEYQEEFVICLISSLVNVVEGNAELKDDLRFMGDFIQSLSMTYIATVVIPSPIIILLFNYIGKWV